MTESETSKSVFGPRAVFVLVAPLAFFLVALSVGGWLDRMALRIELEPARAPVLEALEALDPQVEGLDGGIAGRLDLDDLRAAIEAGRDAPTLREEGEALLASASGRTGVAVQEARSALEEYIATVDARDQVRYPRTYAIVIGLTALLALLAVPGYRQAPVRVGWLSVGVGVVGVVVWIGLWMLDQRVLHLASLFGPSRAAYNPFEELSTNVAWMWTFVGIRFTGLVLVVPLIEEFFVRGFWMRFLDAKRWDELPLGHVTAMSAGGVAFYALLSHPAEPLAAVVWFSMVTWLYHRTQSIWDCVAAHAITNLLLGIYVVATGTWALW